MLRVDGNSQLVFEYPVEFENGKCSGFNRREFDDETRHLSGKYVIRVSKPRKNRSTRQNRVQWWYFNEIAKETGHTPHMIKGMMQLKFLKREAVDEDTGEIFEYVKGTSELSTTEHNDFMEDVRMWAFEHLQMNLPLPNDVDINFE